MKKWLRKIGVHVAQAVIERFEPKINEMTNATLKAVLLFSLSWVNKVLDVLTDADPDDQKQLELIAQDFIENAPKESLVVSKLILMSKIKDEEARLFIGKIIDELIEDAAS